MKKRRNCSTCSLKLVVNLSCFHLNNDLEFRSLVKFRLFNGHLNVTTNWVYTKWSRLVGSIENLDHVKSGGFGLVRYSDRDVICKVTVLLFVVQKKCDQLLHQICVQAYLTNLLSGTICSYTFPLQISLFYLSFN